MCDIPPQTCESMNSSLDTGDLPAVAVNVEASFEPVQDAVLDLRERVEDLCNQELSKFTKQGLYLFCLLIFSHLIFHHLIVYFLSVNDTTLFTLGDCKFQILVFDCCSFVQACYFTMSFSFSQP